MNKNVCYYHVRYSDVKLGYINSVSTVVAAPQLIQPSVAIETGLVFQSAQQLELEEKNTVQNIHGCACLSVYALACVSLRVHTYTLPAPMYPLILL